MRRQLPNIFTLFNLFFGCMAIVAVTETDISFNTDSMGRTNAELSGQICLASLFIAFSAIVDFLDGLVARFMGVDSEIGKQLDSLADVVSFGVAPGMILFEFLRRAYGLAPSMSNIHTLLLLPAFLLPCAGAYRLARFNVDKSHSTIFTGLPIPAAGLLIASFPMMNSYCTQHWVSHMLQSASFLYVICVAISYLMISSHPMLSLKKKASLRDLQPFLIIAFIAIFTAIILGWIAVPVTFIAYVILSLLYNSKVYDIQSSDQGDAS